VADDACWIQWLAGEHVLFLERIQPHEQLLVRLGYERTALALDPTV
jgi:hypothetical protein